MLKEIFLALCLNIKILLSSQMTFHKRIIKMLYRLKTLNANYNLWFWQYLNTLIALYQVNTSLLLYKIFVSNKMFYSFVNKQNTRSVLGRGTLATRKVSIFSLHHTAAYRNVASLNEIKWKAKRSKAKKKLHGLPIN